MVSLIPTAPTPYDPKSWGERVDIKRINRVRVPQLGPQRWKALPHGSFVTMIEQAFTRHGFQLSEPNHYMSKVTNNVKIKDQSEFGKFLSMYGIAHPDLPDMGTEMSWEAAFVNSYDMTKSARGTLGRRVFVCSNGMFSGESGFRRKHTTGIDPDKDSTFSHIWDMLDETVKYLVPQAHAEVKRIEVYKNTPCSDDDARWCILQAAKTGQGLGPQVIQNSGTVGVLKHWEEPEHPEFKDRNLWSLENAFTSHDRGRSLMTQGTRMSRLSSIFDDRFGLETSESSVGNPDNEASAVDF